MTKYLKKKKNMLKYKCDYKERDKKMKKPIIIGIIATVAVVIVMIISTIIYYAVMTSPVNTKGEEVEINISEGSTATNIGQLLKEKDLIKSEFAFKIYISMNKVNGMKAGEYLLNKNMSVEQITKILVEGAEKTPDTVNITFLEGKNMRWIAKQIADKTDNSEQDVYDTLSNEGYINSLIEKYWFITDDIKNKDIYYPLEGYLYPDTYNFLVSKNSVQDIFNTMLDQMEEVLNPYKAEIQNSGLSVHKLLTVSSIVELEAAKQEDRSGVASVIYNRIKYNMPIGSDVTTYYAIKVDMSERDLKQSELDLSNPYNTRNLNMAGKLPVGPICTVERKTIEAALHPDSSEYLYFVADKNGKIYFAKNNQEHNNNISNLKQQGLWYNYE